ncbi:MAG TPA: tRNA (N6-isopentenyl adenosine(37)-C2)-methylthiotransferase MiaB [bacterium]|nr:tRNA (N6-isopentenyl adenosine(37)-C2)-methylthiotransferase MiaB [bacterium]HPO51485.1 tRNA (N6-isopentenyl adenosine(37)-C2)-methylthiotransferase MiaB [bacterium]
MKKSFLIKTYGCQMNFAESDRLRKLLVKSGWNESASIKDAGLVIAVGCSVRQKAENRVLSFLKSNKHLKKNGALLGLVGCTANLHGEKILKQLPFLDIVCGPNHLASIIDNLSGFTGQQIIVRTGESDDPFLEYIPSNNEITMDVPITKGCNNFCSYCIVPFSRGKLKSRKPESILQEIKCAVEKGIKSVTLLGQNVNEYGKDFTNGYDFADLVREIANIDGLLRIGFLTSHPEDTGEKILKTMAECSKVLKHLHIPVQSGSDKILKKMNRKYTVEKFLEVVEMARDMMPEISITSDIIVGFPEETEHDFEQTYELVKKTRFSELFIFKYSPRPMTKAYNMKDDVSKQEKERRHKIILDMQKKISNEILSSFAGKTCQVLAEKISVKNSSQIIGKNIQGISVAFQGDKNILGTIARIKIVNHREGILCGSICEAALSPQDLQCPGKTQK